MRNLKALLLGVFVVTGGLGAVVAEDMKVSSLNAKFISDEPVRAGEYRQLNIWRKFKIWGAPYVNPGLFNDVSVVYSYEPSVFKGVRPEEFAIFLNKGLVAAAAPSSAGIWEANAVAKPMSEEEIKAVMELWASAAEQVKFVSYSSKLFGHKPDGRLVAWKSDAPNIGND